MKSFDAEDSILKLFCAFDQANVNAATPGTESQINIYILWYNTAACALFGSLRAVTHQQQKAFLQDKKMQYA